MKSDHSRLRLDCLVLSGARLPQYGYITEQIVFTAFLNYTLLGLQD